MNFRSNLIQGGTFFYMFLSSILLEYLLFYDNNSEVIPGLIQLTITAILVFTLIVGIAKSIFDTSLSSKDHMMHNFIVFVVLMVVTLMWGGFNEIVIQNDVRIGSYYYSLMIFFNFLQGIIFLGSVVESLMQTYIKGFTVKCR